MKLLFIHGAGGCREQWKFQTEYFSHSEAINLPGHPEGELRETVVDYVDWLHAFLNVDPSEQTILVGHSLGGGIALQYALDYPDALTAIVVVGSGGRLRVRSDILELFENACHDPSLLESYNDLSYGSIEPELAKTIILRSKENTPAAALNDFRAANSFDILPRLTEIRVPVLTVVGENDVLAPPKYSKYIVDAVSGADGVTIKDAGHFVFAEKPADFNAVLAEFLDAL